MVIQPPDGPGGGGELGALKARTCEEPQYQPTVIKRIHEIAVYASDVMSLNYSYP